MRFWRLQTAKSASLLREDALYYSLKPYAGTLPLAP
jgi:hypothetical protein